MLGNYLLILLLVVHRTSKQIHLSHLTSYNWRVQNWIKLNLNSIRSTTSPCWCWVRHRIQRRHVVRIRTRNRHTCQATVSNSESNKTSVNYVLISLNVMCGLPARWQWRSTFRATELKLLSSLSLATDVRIRLVVTPYLGRIATTKTNNPPPTVGYSNINWQNNK